MTTQPDGTNVYSVVVKVAGHYMGPVASRFIARQVRTHFDKEPSQLERKDLDELSKWITIELSLLTDDEASIKEFAERLKSL